MNNQYSAQNIASYIIYELNDLYSFINADSLQHLLLEVEVKWQETFGHSAFYEQLHNFEQGYVVKEVFDTYKEHGTNHIALPAKEYYLPYGTFQLIVRTYGVPAFTKQQQAIVDHVIAQYRHTSLVKAS